MIAVLFARQDSIYKKYPQCDVWDIHRDARNFKGGMPVVAHPPCRAWGGLRCMAFKARPDEKDLGRYSVKMVRENGGVLEHPIRSVLWDDQKLPVKSGRDFFGGFTVYLPQFWFGHRANKASKFYICGIEPAQVPEIPFVLGEAPRVFGSNSHSRRKRKSDPTMPPLRPELERWEREATPRAMAEWLITVAERCKITS